MGAPPSPEPSNDRLDSWKEIAVYLNRDVTTAQRWEKREGMPVHRHVHAKAGSVYAFRSELEAWVSTRKIQTTVNGGAPLAKASPGVRSLTRLIVLPFRMLRADAEFDFLSFSLPDAITTSLSGLTSLIVRSSAASRRYASDPPNLKKIASEAEVDVVLIGTILRVGAQIRIATQLVEAPDAAVLWSQSAQFGLQDVFQMQDELVRRVVESLATPLSRQEIQSLHHDVPASPLAYEYYLRANQWGSVQRQWATARDLYLKCVELDPKYAPAWARLGRCYHLLAKWGIDADYQCAESAFGRAFDLNPDLTLGHHLYASLEADLGHAPRAMVRLLERARTRPNDPNLFAGLVHTCRYCGLLQASLTAHQRARRLDPLVVTTVGQTFFLAGEYQHCLEHSGNDEFKQAFTLSHLGRNEEALRLARDRAKRAESSLTSSLDKPSSTYWLWGVVRAALERKAEECRLAHEGLWKGTNFAGEESYSAACALARAGATEDALHLLARSLERGFVPYPAMTLDPWLDAVRGNPRFAAIQASARARHEDARRMFFDAGGNDLLPGPGR